MPRRGRYDADKRSDGDFGSGNDALARRLCLRSCLDRRQLCGQRHTNAGLAVAVAQPADDELAYRNEAIEAISPHKKPA